MKMANRKGFTMVELLIVLAIIAILAAVAIPVYSSQLENARKEVDNSNLRAATGLAAQDYILREAGSTQGTDKYYAVLSYDNKTAGASGAVTSTNMLVYPVGAKVSTVDGSVTDSNSSIFTITAQNTDGYSITGATIGGKKVVVMPLQQNTGNARFVIKIGKGGVVAESKIVVGSMNTSS